LVWIVGYAAATTNGYFTKCIIINIGLGDVVGGAGFGILSTQIAYLVYPSIKNYYLRINQILISIAY